MISEKEYNALKKNRGKILCAIAFAILGILIVSVGFFKTIFVLVLAAAGFFAGYAIDDKEMVRKFLNSYLGK